jgi:hypothetical protein
MLALKKLLRPDGILLTNLVRGAGHRSLQTEVRKLYRHYFPCVKEVRTPGGLNETLCGGNRLGGISALKPWRSRFSSTRDRHFWDQISIRRLPQLP